MNSVLRESIEELYSRFCVYFFHHIFSKQDAADPELTTVEAFSLECIRTLGEPTVAEFSELMGISAPNAAYKVSSLIQKGYVTKVQSAEDHREYHIVPTEKFDRYFRSSDLYAALLEERIRQRFSETEIEEIEDILNVISEELTPELSLQGRHNGW